MLDLNPSSPENPRFDPSVQEEDRSPGWIPAKALRKARRQEKRKGHQAERARVREQLYVGMHEPEAFLDLESHAKNIRRLLNSGAEQRRDLLATLQRKVKSELANTRDVDGFIEKASRSRTLYTLAAMGFFRQVLESEAFREDHRFKLAIRKALEEPGLAKSLQRRWEQFDREFPAA